MCHKCSLTACEQDQEGTGSVLILLYTIVVCTLKAPDDGQRNCPKHVEFYSKNKFEKLVHLVGFVIRIRFIYLDSKKLTEFLQPFAQSLFYFPQNAVSFIILFFLFK